MRSALDEFEVSLVRASEALYRASAPAPGGASAAQPETGRGGASSAGRFAQLWRRYRWRVPVGVLALGAITAAGSTVLFGPRGNPRTVRSIECGVGTVVSSVTGDPVRDCATLWPTLHGGFAPHLVAWVAAGGGAVVVTPAAARPPGDRSLHWKRLPAGWTQDQTAIQVSHQLADVSSGLAAHSCWSPDAALAVVTATLRADGLGSWPVESQINGGAGTCLTASADVRGDGHSVLLSEYRTHPPAHGSFLTPQGALALRRIAAIASSVNHELSTPPTRCVADAQAAAIWRARARSAGLPERAYVLFEGAARPSSTSCPRVYVDAPGGGGPYTVSIIDLP